MKPTKLILCATVAGAMAFAASNAPAFPLKLVSLGGTISATPSYSAISSTNKAQYITKSFNLKTVMLMVSNTIARIADTNLPPKDAYIAYDPYVTPSNNSGVYLTNSSGYYQSLSSLTTNGTTYYVRMRIEDMATSFKIGSSSGSENDTACTYFAFSLLGLDGGVYYASANYGIGKLTFSGNSKNVSMTITGTGPDYGELNSSYDGTSKLSFVFSGSAPQAEWGDRPFWLWWED